jgi:hypothetical protein
MTRLISFLSFVLCEVSLLWLTVTDLVSTYTVICKSLVYLLCTFVCLSATELIIKKIIILELLVSQFRDFSLLTGVTCIKISFLPMNNYGIEQFLYGMLLL